MICFAGERGSSFRSYPSLPPSLPPFLPTHKKEHGPLSMICFAGEREFSLRSSCLAWLL